MVLFTLHCVAFLTIAGLALIGHGKAMMTNPGAVPELAAPVGTVFGNEVREHICGSGRCIFITT